MSYTKIDKLLPKVTLRKLMKKAQIPGVSIAYIDNKGTISTKEEGFTDGCGLLMMSNDPTKSPFNKLGVGSKNAIILFDNALFYVDHKIQVVQKIEITDSNKADFKKLQARCTDIYQLADNDDHKLIQSLTGRAPPTEVKPETVFGAASLSKPVFAYLVQKLIGANSSNKAELGSGKFILPDGLTHFDLDTPLFHILPLKEFSIGEMAGFDASDESAVNSAKTLTARMVLSHMTGLAHEEIKFQFKPEEKAHGYSNIAILYLQKVIETLTNSTIEVLAKKHVFGPCGMINSTYEPPFQDKCQESKPQAINSLRTTATDYANFVKTLMKDSTLENPFIPHVFMTKDKGQAGAIGVVEGKIPDAALNHVAWGLGWGLQTDNEGKATTAYHSGDMNDYRAWVVVNLKDKSAVVFFANSHNGHILAEQIIPPTFALKHAANYFFPKWGFARNFEELGGETNKWGIKPSLEPKAIILPIQQQVVQTDTNNHLITPFQTIPNPMGSILK